ncbi:MAG: acyl-CoA dehydrogenase [Acidobacteria bacterium]|nr:acyl-CoA dehydrogenase [Acidobacteriota bacterium]
MLIKRRDLEFLLYEWLDVEEVLARPRFAEHTRDTVTAVLDMCNEIALAEFLPHYKRSDIDEPRLTAHGVSLIPEIAHALKVFAEAGLPAAVFDTEFGGMQLPEVVYSAAMSHFAAANVATSAYSVLSVANARLLTAFGTAPQIETFARPQIEGRWLGTMCLSEPHAGSSLADINTRAIPDGREPLGARFRLFGNKMWISGGEHEMSENIVHLVLAKVPGADGHLVPGVGGISLFVVPRSLTTASGEIGERNDITVGGLNHKMGYRGTVNCLLNFGESLVHRPQGASGAVGYLIGRQGQGLALMFHMMNEARISIGLGAAMLGYRGYQRSLGYARERPQGRRLGAKGSGKSAPPVPIIEHADVKRMLLAQKAYVEVALAMVLYCAKLADDRRTAESPDARACAERLLDLLTPVVKTWPSEWGLAANDLAIQVYGGYGYARDYDVEQLYRDNRLNPIHEGTTGVQALDLLGRKVLRDGGAALDLLRARIEHTAGRAGSHPSLRAYAARLTEAWNQIAAVSQALITAADEAVALQNATPFLWAFGHAVAAWLWLDQAIVATTCLAGNPGQADRAFYAGKLRACRFFFECELPKIGSQLAFVGSHSDVAGGMPLDAF